MSQRSTYVTTRRRRSLAVVVTTAAMCAAINPSYASQTPSSPSEPYAVSLTDDGAMFSYDGDTGQARFRSCDVDTGRRPAEATTNNDVVRGSLNTPEAVYDFVLRARAQRGRVSVTPEGSGTPQVLTGPVTRTPPLEEPGHAKWAELESDLQEVLSRADPGNRISVSVQDLSGAFDGARVTAGVDDRYRSASTIKVPILVELLRLVECGEISLDETITVTEDDVVGGSGELKDRELPLDLSVQYLANLMTTASDNTATNVLIDRVGLDGVNSLTDMQNLDETWLGRKMMQPADPEAGVENYITAEEAVTHLTDAWDTSLIASSRGVFLNLLRDQERDRFFERAIPGVPVAHKTGGLAGGRAVTHDIGYILEPGREVALAVMTEGPRDTAVPTAVELVRVVHQHITADVPDRTESTR